MRYEKSTSLLLISSLPLFLSQDTFDVFLVGVTYQPFHCADGLSGRIRWQVYVSLNVLRKTH